MANEVYIGGFKPASMLERPGLISGVLFTVGCNLRCPFCHNPELVVDSKGIPPYPVNEILKALAEKKGWVDSVIFTGGEPTMQKGLRDMMRYIKEEGFQVGIHTNGANPKALGKLLDEGLLSHVAMDVKASKEKYSTAVGIPGFKIGPILESIKLIKAACKKVDTIFRTTAVPGLVEPADMAKIGKMVQGAPLVSIQQFRTLKCVNPEYEQKEPHSTEVLHKMADELEQYVGRVNREFI